jgi:hypothetical protein
VVVSAVKFGASELIRKDMVLLLIIRLHSRLSEGDTSSKSRFALQIVQARYDKVSVGGNCVYLCNMQLALQRIAQRVLNLDLLKHMVETGGLVSTPWF